MINLDERNQSTASRSRYVINKIDRATIRNFFQEPRALTSSRFNPAQYIYSLSRLDVDSSEPVMRLRLEMSTRERKKMRVYVVIDRCVTRPGLNKAKVIAPR